MIKRNIIKRPTCLYVLGACFGIEGLEKKHRPKMLEDYHEWIISTEGQHECKLLTKWAPGKIPKLLQDACLNHFELVNEEYEEMVAQHSNSVEEAQEQYEEQWETMNNLISQAYEVLSSI
jgi:hypothetical protein